MGWSKSTRIKAMLGIDTAFFLLELGVGVAVGSLALTADAFHMLNDVISLVVGLWAVTAARKSSTDKYSFGWLRAEILGAFFNAVFLIGLCLTIVLEALTRLLEPPEIGRPKLILIVGSLGLASNLIGFLVLGGHGHSHGPEGHDHAHGDELTAAEEGHSHASEAPYRDDDGPQEPVESEVGEVFPEAVLAKAQSKPGHIRFTSPEEHDSPSKHVTGLRKSMSTSPSPIKNRRRTNSRVRNIDDISIHPSRFRQDILAVTRPQRDETDSEDSSTGADEAVLDDGETLANDVPLPLDANGEPNGTTSNDHTDNREQYQRATGRPRHDSWHATHNHNKPKKRSKGGHSHADMGMNAMILHVIGDALGNVGVIASALIIWLTDWSGRYYADPAVSLFIALIILKSTIPLTSATAKVLLQATPDDIEVTEIKQDIQSIPGVVSCHHVHIWQLSDTQFVASMHIQVAFPIYEAAGEKYMEVARAARKCLHAYGIHSATIQPEFCTDRAHDHVVEGASVGLDGIVGMPRCGLDDDACLLECIDDCTKAGCCPPASPNGRYSDHDGSDHSGHNH